MRRQDPRTSIRPQKSLYLPTFKLDIKEFTLTYLFCPPALLWWEMSGLVVSALDSGSKGPGSNPGWVIVLCSWARY